MIIIHQTNVSAFAGGHTYWFLPNQVFQSAVTEPSAPAAPATLTIAVSGWG